MQQSDSARPYIYDDNTLLDEYYEELEKRDPIPEYTTSPLVLSGNQEIVLAEGLKISANMSEEEIDLFLDMIGSYKGVKPRLVGDSNMIGQWHVCLGCILMPFVRSKEYVDEVTGEAKSITRRWYAPLFKMQKKDENGEHIILTGGGQNSVEFCREQAALGRAGDWNRPREILFSQEERSSIDKDTGKMQPTRLYRIRSRSIQQQGKEA